MDVIVANVFVLIQITHLRLASPKFRQRCQSLETQRIIYNRLSAIRPMTDYKKDFCYLLLLLAYPPHCGRPEKFTSLLSIHGSISFQDILVEFDQKDGLFLARRQRAVWIRSPFPLFERHAVRRYPRREPRSRQDPRDDA